MSLPRFADAPEECRPYRPYGAALELMYSRAPEIVLAGPAGTGKSRAVLEKLHLCAERYPGMRALMLRATRKSLTESAMVTFEAKVLPVGHPAALGPRRQQRSVYRYPNGSELVCAGLDDPGKVMSSEWDMIYIQEAIDVTEDGWERCTTRLGRNTAMPYAQLLADTNPDAPSHWLKRRSERGGCLMIESRHEDNPSVTPEYLATLDRLTGVRYQRLRLGLWVAAEGMVYEGWNAAIHRVDRFEIPWEWPRYWAVDFGFTNPFVWQAWAQDPDGRLYRYQELYVTGKLVEDVAQEILALTEGDPKPRAIICDHDAEDRATLERKLGMGTIGAYKAIRAGIQAVSERLRVAGDGRSRICFLRDSLPYRDQRLDEQRKPASTEEEFDGYVWNLSSNRKKGEEPVREDDHGLDATRYLVAFVDRISGGQQRPSAILSEARSR